MHAVKVHDIGEHTDELSTLSLDYTSRPDSGIKRGLDVDEAADERAAKLQRSGPTFQVQILRGDSRSAAYNSPILLVSARSASPSTRSRFIEFLRLIHDMSYRNSDIDHTASMLLLRSAGDNVHSAIDILRDGFIRRRIGSKSIESSTSELIVFENSSSLQVNWSHDRATENFDHRARRILLYGGNVKEISGLLSEYARCVKEGMPKIETLALKKVGRLLSVICKWRRDAIDLLHRENITRTELFSILNRARAEFPKVSCPERLKLEHAKYLLITFDECTKGLDPETALDWKKRLKSLAPFLLEPPALRDFLAAVNTCRKKLTSPPLGLDDAVMVESTNELSPAQFSVEWMERITARGDERLNPAQFYSFLERRDNLVNLFGPDALPDAEPVMKRIEDWVTLIRDASFEACSLDQLEHIVRSASEIPVRFDQEQHAANLLRSSRELLNSIQCELGRERILPQALERLHELMKECKVCDEVRQSSLYEQAEKIVQAWFLFKPRLLRADNKLELIAKASNHALLKRVELRGFNRLVTDLESTGTI